MHARLVTPWRRRRGRRAIERVVANWAVRRPPRGGPGVERKQCGEVEGEEGG